MTFLFSKTGQYLRTLLKEFKQSHKIRLLKKRYFVFAICVFLFIVLITISFSGMAIFSLIQVGNQFDIESYFPTVPPSIIQDARNLAIQLYGKTSDSELYFQQLLSAYQLTVDKQFLIIFNLGGWGTKTLEDSSNWTSIIDGIQTELVASGYKVVALNYQRTTDNIVGQINEVEEAVTGYILKAKDLAQRVEFLTSHNPELCVILAGESTGTMICDSTMNLLKENTRVYSIQTGSPFWQKNTIRDRTVVVNDNGLIPDTFSRGDLFTAVKSNLKRLLGNNQPEEGGMILNFLSAPGHEYWWDNPNVYNQIGMFLEQYFEIQFDLQEE